MGVYPWSAAAAFLCQYCRELGSNGVGVGLMTTPTECPPQEDVGAQDPFSRFPSGVSGSKYLVNPRASSPIVASTCSCGLRYEAGTKLTEGFAAEALCRLEWAGS